MFNATYFKAAAILICFTVMTFAAGPASAESADITALGLRFEKPTPALKGVTGFFERSTDNRDGYPVREKVTVAGNNDARLADRLFQRTPATPPEVNPRPMLSLDPSQGHWEGGPSFGTFLLYLLAALGLLVLILMIAN